MKGDCQIAQMATEINCLRTNITRAACVRQYPAEQRDKQKQNNNENIIKSKN